MAKELTFADAMKDKEYSYFYRLLLKNYLARLDPEFAIAKYFIDNYGTTDLRDMGRNGIPHYQNVQRKMYRVKSVFHVLQPSEEDKALLKHYQEQYKEINRDGIVPLCEGYSL